MEVIIVITLIFCVSLAGFFITKTVGFGKYTASLLLFILVLFSGTLGFVTGKVDWPSFSNILFAVAGFAGGLVTPKAE